MQQERISSSSSWVTWCCVLGYSLSFAAFGLQVNLLGPTASVLARKLEVVEADLGIIFTINGFASIVGAMPSGYLTDKLPGHMVLAAALAFEALGFVLMPFCSSMLALIATFGFVALSWNIINTAGNTYVLWIAAEAAAAAKAARAGTSGNNGGNNDSSSSEGSSVLINTVNAAFGVGSLGAPVVAELCATRLGQPLAAYWITAALTAVSAITFLLLPSPKPPAAVTATRDASGESGIFGTQDGGVDSSNILQQPLLAAAAAAADDDGVGNSGEAVSAAAEAARPEKQLWSGTLLMLLGVTAVFNLLNVGTEVGYGGWIFTYATKQAGLSEHEGHAVNAAYWGSFTLGRVLASLAALVLTPSTLLFASLPLALLGALAALLTPAALMQQQGRLLLTGATVLIGLGVAPGFANCLALLDSYCPCTGNITGLLGGVAGAGCMTIPLVVALLAKHTVLQYQGLMWVCLASFAVQLACVPLLMLVGRRLPQEGEQEGDEYASVTKDLLDLQEQDQLAADEGV